MRPCASAGFAAIALLAAAGSATAQAATDAAGRMLDPAPRVGGDPLAACADTPAATAEEVACDVVEAIDLGTVPESWLVRYHRTAEESEGAVNVVVEREEFVLLEASGSGFRAVWHAAVDTRNKLLSAEGIAIVGGATVASYRLCLRGTGGCTQQFLIRDGLGWGIVEQPFLSSLAALAPENWALHKGREIDLRSLSGEQPLLGPDDPNSSPSGMIRFSLSLNGRALELVDATVDVPEPPSPPDSTGGTPR